MSSSRYRFARILSVAGILVGTSGCNRGILDPVGPVAAAEKQILINSTAIMLAIIIPTMIATVAVAFWFRRGNKKAVYRPDWEYSGAIELVIWAIPVLTILLLGGITWIGSHQLDPRRPLDSKVPPITVQVVSLDWKWLFIYPDQGVATVNKLVIPAGTPVNFQLTSATVWNTFFVPQMGSMIYTMPNMTTRLNLQADRVGVFEGRSAHFSGDGFPGMEFNVYSMPPQQFAAWAQSARSGAALDAKTYQALERPSSYVRPMTFGAVQPGLFDAIAMGNHAQSAQQQRPHNLPSPGASTAQPESPIEGPSPKNQPAAKSVPASGVPE
ncbi:ubiquinol oxidase subunit II [Sphingomonas flavescens]|uniref:ubiquinol oxidase subunit II n=1 Tax=Sphingomonas flavescens TaxID=3132797 RepID=UPI002803CB26|nr:ubiquinol oxidase subunit II [Sphingomonas limnosediminicola]